jgi:3-deoxy-D-manno-octulosonic-acid transferase
MHWPLFLALERLSDLRGNVAAQGSVIETPATPQPALWVYVSTLGELNAVQPLLQRVVAALPHLRPVLITEHAHYRPAYLARYPQASVCITRGHSRDAAALARHFPPRLLLVAEIPALPSDAPCRFSHAFVRAARGAGAGLALVNGWLYHYTPASRMDALERRWFERAQVQAFDLLCVQRQEIAQRLQQAGAAPQRLVVTGNLKFDAVPASGAALPAPRSPALLQALARAGRPVVVAGNLTRDDEQDRVLDALGLLRRQHPQALQVLAPRHPEVPRNLQQLRQALQQRGLHAQWRSALGPAGEGTLAPETDVLVLDTMGDLRDVYAAAAVAHVGVDHNVLEPLAFDKPVTVCSGWDATYPSYPVYTLLSEAGALLHGNDATTLAAHWAQALLGGAAQAAHAARVRGVLAQAAGATARHLAALRPLLQAAGASAAP